MQAERAPSYVVLSDVHLGADLVEHVRPWSRDSWLRDQAAIDEHVEALLQRCAQSHARVCFVIAGDFVDFMGMSLAAPAGTELRSGVTEEELAHGLGSAADHAVLKLRAVAARHARAFRALARVLAAGHSLVIVRGNHDLEWHWGAVRQAFVDAVAAHAKEPAEIGAIRAGISFRQWFFHVPGLLYVEHGHEFDPMCSQGDPLSATCVRDRRRMRDTTSHVLMRYVARPTPQLSTVGHERATFGAYCRLAASFGLRGGLRLTRRFARAVLRLLGDAFVYRRHRGRLERRAQQRLRAFARKERIGQQALEALRALHVRPGSDSLRATCQHLYLDRVALVALCALALVFVVAGVSFREALLAAAANALGACAVAMVSGGRDIDPESRMRSAAETIARTLGVRYVLMGHTHGPRMDRLASGAHYANLGFWGEDELPEDRRPDSAGPTRTFFSLVADARGYHGTLMRWDAALGPVPVDRSSSSEPQTDGSELAATIVTHWVQGDPARERLEHA